MSGDREAYQMAMREAHALAWALKWETAGQKYREALAEFPNDPTARLSLAVALTRIGNAPEALREYSTVRVLLPNDTLILSRIADLHARQGNAKEAVQACVDQARLHAAQHDDEKALGAVRRGVDYAGRDRRSFESLREAAQALSGRPAVALVSEIDSLVAALPAAAQSDSREAAPEAAGAVVAESKPQGWPAADWGPSDEAAPNRIIDDPSQLAEAAERSAGLGQRVTAIAHYLLAADLVGEPGRANELTTRAQALVGDWMLGELAEVAEVPSAQRPAVLEAMVASHDEKAAGQYVLATDSVFRAVGNAPRYLPAQLRLAEIEYCTGRREHALERIQQVAALYDLRGERERAVATLRLRMEIDPDREAVRRMLVDFLVEIGQRDRAAVEAHSWSGDREAAGDLAMACALRRECTTLDPRPEYWLSFAETSERLADLPTARDAYHQALSLSSDDSAALAGVNRCDAALEDWPEMELSLGLLASAAKEGRLPLASVDALLAEYRAALGRLGPCPGLTYCLATMLIASGQEANGEVEYSRIVRVDSRPGRLACYHLGERLSLAGRPRDAIELLWRVGVPDSSASESDRILSISAHRLLVDTCAKAGDWDGTARAIEGLLRIYPSEDALHTRLAEVYFRLRKLSDALRVLGELAEVYVERGETERAISVARGRSQIAPLDGRVRVRLGRMLIDAGRTDEGLGELDTAVKLISADGRASEAADVVRLMLDICRQRDAARALTLRETLVSLVPDDVEARLELIEAYLKAGRSVKAESAGRELVENMLSEYRLADAARALRLVTRLDPWNLTDRVRLGRVLGQLGEIDEALTTLRNVLARDPSNVGASAGLAELLARGAPSEER